MALDDMTPEQLRALADEKESEAAPVIPINGGRGDFDPSAPKGHFVVNVLDMDIDVDMANLDDFELIDDLQAVQAGNALMVPSVMRRILGKDQMDRIIANLKARNPQGRATVTDMEAIIEAVFTYQGEVKN